MPISDWSSELFEAISFCIRATLRKLVNTESYFHNRIEDLLLDPCTAKRFQQDSEREAWTYPKHRHRHHHHHHHHHGHPQPRHRPLHRYRHRRCHHHKLFHRPHNDKNHKTNGNKNNNNNKNAKKKKIKIRIGIRITMIMLIIRIIKRRMIIITIRTISKMK